MPGVSPTLEMWRNAAIWGFMSDVASDSGEVIRAHFNDQFIAACDRIVAAMEAGALPQERNICFSIPQQKEGVRRNVVAWAFEILGRNDFKLPGSHSSPRPSSGQ